MKGRRDRRHSVSCPAEIRGEDGIVLPCRVRDVSEGGAQLVLDAGTKLPARFRLSFGPAREVGVTTRWHRGARVGVAFER